MEKLPFSIILSPDNGNGSHDFSLPAFGTKVPVGLQLKPQTPKGVVIWDLRWPHNISHCVAGGVIDLRIFEKPIQFRLQQPRYHTEAHLHLSNLSMQRQQIEGELLVDDPAKKPFINLFPLSIDHKIKRDYWNADLAPGGKARFWAKTQLPGDIREILLPPGHTALIDQHLLDMTVETYRFKRPPRGHIIDEDSRRQCRFTVDSGRIYVTYPASLDPDCALSVSFKNRSNETIWGVTAAATLEIVS